MTASEQEWIRDYARLALRVNRQLTESSGGTLLIYRGPAEWSEEAAKEPLPPPGRLVDQRVVGLGEPLGRVEQPLVDGRPDLPQAVERAQQLTHARGGRDGVRGDALGFDRLPQPRHLLVGGLALRGELGRVAPQRLGRDLALSLQLRDQLDDGSAGHQPAVLELVGPDEFIGVRDGDKPPQDRHRDQRYQQDPE